MRSITTEESCRLAEKDFSIETMLFMHETGTNFIINDGHFSEIQVPDRK